MKADPMARLCAVAEKAIAELAESRRADAALIKKLVDTIVLSSDKDAQIRRIELETVGTAETKVAEAQAAASRAYVSHLNGRAPSSEVPEVEIPGRA